MPLALSGLYYTDEGKKKHNLLPEQTQHDNKKADDVMS